MLDQIKGKVYVASDGTEYGPWRSPSIVEINGNSVLAEDSCGNWLVQAGGRIQFIEHETDEAVALSDSEIEFIQSCKEPDPVVLKPGQVKSVWIDPEFARTQGIEVPPDGHLKRAGQQADPADRASRGH